MDKLAIIDFETLDVLPNTTVLSLGAAVFDPSKRNTWDELEQCAFIVEFDTHAYQERRTKSASTQLFWDKQKTANNQAYNLAFNSKHAVSPKNGLLQFNDWLTTHKVTHLVGNGSNFDNPILDSLYNETHVKPVIEYYRSLDLRTMRWLNGGMRLDFPTIKIKHYALHDAIHEAMEFQNAYLEIKGS